MEPDGAEAPRWEAQGGTGLTRLYRVILPVADIDEAARFYARLLGIAGKRVSRGRHYFDCEGTILACFDSAAEDDESLPPNPEHIYLAVADLEATRALAKDAGASELGEIATMPWGERCFYARDPFGNPLCLVDEKTLFTGQFVVDVPAR